ncbi:hypothetical protein [Chitinimonas naiadis]
MKSATSLVTGLIGGFLTAVILLAYLHARAPYPADGNEVQAATVAAAQASLDYTWPKSATRVNLLIDGKAVSPQILAQIKNEIPQANLYSNPDEACSPRNAHNATACADTDFLDAHFLSMPFLHISQIQVRTRNCTQVLMLFKYRESWHPLSNKQVCKK